MDHHFIPDETVYSSKKKNRTNDEFFFFPSFNYKKNKTGDAGTEEKLIMVADQS